MVRANQGHTMEQVRSEDLCKVVSASDLPKYPVAVHGTYWNAWASIKTSGGLHHMKRNHIHIATGLPESGGVISGMRRTSQVFRHARSFPSTSINLKEYSLQLLREKHPRAMSWFHLPVTYYTTLLHTHSLYSLREIDVHALALHKIANCATGTANYAYAIYLYIFSLLYTCISGVYPFYLSVLLTDFMCFPGICIRF